MLSKALEDEGEVTEEGQSMADQLKGVNFGDQIHNMVRQYLYAIKADGVAEAAIKALKDGKSPVIGAFNTMETILDDLHKDGFPFSFDGMLNRYLKKALEVTVKDANGKSKKVQINLDDLRQSFPNIEQIPNEAIAMARSLKRDMGVIADLIKETDRSGIPVSPIDHIRNKIEAAGYKFGEISGRGSFLDKSGKLVNRPRGETTQAGKNRILGDFNRNEGSALFLTASGTTGISAHSSTKFRNQAQRQMIVAQFLPDVNDQIQLYGRVLRKGQRVNPEYVNLASTIPAENRLLSILGAKLKSLNANVTSASEGVTSGAAGGVDFMNQYGDEIAWNYFNAHPEVVAEMRHTFKDGTLPDLESVLNSETHQPGDFVRKASGEIAVLSYDEQADFYDHLLSEYTAHIDFLNEIGENMLKSQTLKLDAETVSSQAIFQGNGDSVFDGPAQLEKLKVTSSKKPLPATELPALAEKNREKVDAAYTDFAEKSKDAVAAHMAAIAEKHAGKENIEEIRAAHETRLLDAQNQISRAFSLFDKPVLYTNAEGTVVGYVTDVKFDPAKPVTPSAHKITVYVNTEQQHVTIPVSQLSKVEQFRNPGWDGNYTRLANIATNKSVVTGNLIGGYGAVNSLGGEGRVITYTTKDGEVKTGIMMPRKFNPATSIKPVTTGQQLVEILRKSLPVSTPGGAELHWARGEIEVRVPSSKLRGGKYWQDQRLLSLVAGGEMRQVGNKMVGNVAEHNADALVAFFKDISDSISSFEAPKPEKPEAGGPLGTPVDKVAKVAWDTAINAAALATKAGRRTQQVIAQAKGVFHERYPGATKEETERLGRVLQENLGKIENVRGSVANWAARLKEEIGSTPEWNNLTEALAGFEERASTAKLYIQHEVVDPIREKVPSRATREAINAGSRPGAPTRSWRSGASDRSPTRRPWSMPPATPGRRT